MLAVIACLLLSAAFPAQQNLCCILSSSMALHALLPAIYSVYGFATNLYIFALATSNMSIYVSVL